jgi:hypothetical protein
MKDDAWVELSSELVACLLMGSKGGLCIGIRAICFQNLVANGSTWWQQLEGNADTFMGTLASLVMRRGGRMGVKEVSMEGVSCWWDFGRCWWPEAKGRRVQWWFPHGQLGKREGRINRRYC